MVNLKCFFSNRVRECKWLFYNKKIFGTTSHLSCFIDFLSPHHLRSSPSHRTPAVATNNHNLLDNVVVAAQQRIMVSKSGTTMRAAKLEQRWQNKTKGSK
mgnify:FL=1